MIAALSAVDRLSDESADSYGWVATGEVADALGVSAGDAAAVLRRAAERGLCSSRRSLADGAAWRLTPTGALAAARGRRPRSAAG